MFRSTPPPPSIPGLTSSVYITVTVLTGVNGSDIRRRRLGVRTITHTTGGISGCGHRSLRRDTSGPSPGIGG